MPKKSKVNIVTLTPDNLDEVGCRCFMKAEDPGHLEKLKWTKARLKKGLRIKQLFPEGEKKSVGFIEYIPGGQAWRAVNAEDYMFIHCIWVSPNLYKDQGYGSLLIKDCVKEARAANMLGVATVASGGSFMAGRELFQANGFKSVDSAPPTYELMVKQIQKAPPPTFRDPEKRLAGLKGLQILYAVQCPWVARSIDELTAVAEAKGLKIKVTKLNTAKKIQNAPSVYGTFNLVYNGKLLADHYLSSTRFKNILEKELAK